MKKRTAWALALAVLSGAALAEWSEIEKFEDGTRVFVDAASARRSGDTAELTHLVRWGEAQVEDGVAPYRSTVVVANYDCVGKREWYLASSSYAGAMGTGAKVLADRREADSWASISESSMEEKLWKIACASR